MAMKVDAMVARLDLVKILTCLLSHRFSLEWFYPLYSGDLVTR